MNEAARSSTNLKLIKFLKRNFLAVVLTILPPPIFWYFIERESKSVEIGIESEVPIVSVSSEFTDGIEIRYRGTSIGSAKVVQLVLANTGNRPIELSDYSKPIFIEFNGRILSSPEITKSKPSDLGAAFETASDVIKLTPLLLNPDDTLNFRVLVEVENGKPAVAKVGGRLIGVEEVKLVNSKNSKDFFGDEKLLELVVGMLAGLLSVSSGALIYARGKRLRGVLTFDKEDTEILENNVRRLLSTMKARPVHKEEVSQLSSRKTKALFARIRLENLIGRVAVKFGVVVDFRRASVLQHARNLVSAKMIPEDLYRLVERVSPLLNRELHELESYLTDSDFNEMLKASETAITAFEKILDN